MHWTGEGRIEVSRNFALGVTAVIIALALAAMFLIGMVIGGDGDDDKGSIIPPTPTVLAAEEETEIPTETAMATAQQEETETPTKPQTGTKTEYSTCLFRTHRSLLLDLESARFTPWPDYGDNRSAWDVIRYRHIDYISDHCQDQAPAPPSTYSSTCVPRELQSFYRRHIPEGSDNDNLRAIAGQYALTVCQPAADR